MPPPQNQTAYLVWAIVCLAICVILVGVEFILPSGGMIGLAAAGALLGGVILLMMYDPFIGKLAAIGSLLAVPFVILLLLKVWPSTPIARFLTLRGATEAIQPGTGPSAGDPDALIGQTGRALTDLRPVGSCTINGKRVECLSDGGVIRAGAAVRVVAVEGMEVKVREVE